MLGKRQDGNLFKIVREKSDEIRFFCLFKVMNIDFKAMSPSASYGAKPLHTTYFINGIRIEEYLLFKDLTNGYISDSNSLRRKIIYYEKR